MNDAAKIQLSSAEMALAGDASIILTKNSIMGKAVALMADLSEAYRVEWPRIFGTAGLPEELGSTEPKISKGENYNGLPWVMLDYPRSFGKEDVFAIRTMFWWGHGFQVILHLKGRYQQLLLPRIQRRLGMLADAGFHWGVSGDEWRHELTEDNYIFIGHLLVPRTAETQGGATRSGALQGGQVFGRGGAQRSANPLPQPSFVKLAAPCPLEKWNEAHVILRELFSTLGAALMPV